MGDDRNRGRSAVTTYSEQSDSLRPRSCDGLRVLDLSRHLAGPYLAMMLADHGADVVKVESLAGDPIRGIGTDGDDDGPLFLGWNRGKRSIAIDVRDSRGLAAMQTMIKEADVLIENFRPGVADRLGIGFDDMSQLNPGLIYCSISGFGQSGPLAAQGATDPVGQAMSGVMSVTGPSDGPPMLVGVPVADVMAAMVGLQGVLLALVHRSSAGVGQHVDVSLLSALLATLTTRVATYWGTGEPQQRWGGAHSVVTPYEVFETSDGHIVAGIHSNDQWSAFCEAIGRTDLALDDRFTTNSGRAAHREVLSEQLGAAFRAASTGAWEKPLVERGLLYAPVLTIEQVVQHPHVLANGLIGELTHPTQGPIKQVGSPIGLSLTPARMNVPPPLLGQHSVEVLRAAGIGQSEIDELVESGVVHQGSRIPDPH